MITTHVLDTSQGRPAAGVPVLLERQNERGKFATLGQGMTGSDGRLRTLLADGTPVVAGVYRLTFDTSTYFSAQSVRGFFPSVTVMFEIADVSQHFHVPLLLSPFGYSTYRGS